MTRDTGGAWLAHCLRAEGVTHVFGIIDGTYFGFYRALHDLGIAIVTPRHETTAAHMAGAYARLTGRLGVCMASNGPGVANLLPGLVVEQAEGNRVLAITSARRPAIMYPDRGGAYQCFDQSGTIGRFAKSSAAVSSAARLPELARRALRACHEGRPGVVHLDVPETIMNGEFDAAAGAWPPARTRRRSPLEPAATDVAAAADLLRAADEPMIHVGSGVIHAAAFDELARVAEALQAPVTTSWAARGALSERSPLAIPMPHVVLNHAVRRAADVVLAVGARLGETDWWGKPPYWGEPARQRMIQVDVDGQNIGLHKPVDLGVVADARRFLGLLADALAQQAPDDQRLETRRARVARWQRRIAKDRARWDAALDDRAAPMHPAHVASACQRVFPRQSVLVVDGGNAAIWSMFHSRVEVPGTLLSTFKFGMLGAGQGQAIGAAVARPGQAVCCITGDGAMGFHPQEIETAVRVGAPVVFVVMVDRQWGMVKMNQQFALRPFKTLVFRHLDPDETIKADLGEIRWDELARSMGAHGERATAPHELVPALERALASGGCAVVHVDVDPVKHMWAPGLVHFKKMHEEPAGR